MSSKLPVTLISSYDKVDHKGQRPITPVLLGLNEPIVRVYEAQVRTAGWHKIFDQLGASKDQQMALITMHHQLASAFIDPNTGEQKMRKSGEAWYQHLKASTLILIYELGILDPDVVAASLGRDLLEDPVSERNCRLGSEKFEAVDFLTRTYGERIVRLIESQTKPSPIKRREHISDIEFEAQKLGAYIKLYQQGNPVEQIALKLAARLHNLRTATTFDSQKNELIESAKYLEPLVKEFMSDKERTLLKDAMEPYRSMDVDPILLAPVNYPKIPSKFERVVTKVLGRW